MKDWLESHNLEDRICSAIWKIGKGWTQVNLRAPACVFKSNHLEQSSYFFVSLCHDQEQRGQVPQSLPSFTFAFLHYVVRI